MVSNLAMAGGGGGRGGGRGILFNRASHHLNIFVRRKLCKWILKV